MDYVIIFTPKTGLKPDPEKIKAIKELTRFRTIKNTKKIKKYQTILRIHVPFQWEEVQEKVFILLTDFLCQEPLLRYLDFTKPFVVTTDASNYAIGQISQLSQDEIEKDLPITYASRLLNQTE
uniref:Reverse transcriptase/retrotransposon-derived protein RNase H-like domain-containing protein n=1 Tax=Vespula pensylvanica TaxID=30213 RepID=A0A834N111_VESPE|nr:hypothetical protein H0235_017461 [Vespula pensylvanica]